MPFSDEVCVKVSAGDGGKGCVSSSRGRGGPDGGDGGQGGHIILTVDKRKSSLSHLNSNKIYKASSGADGQARKKNGKRGQNLIIPVPPQTWMKWNNKQVLLDQSYLLITGGRGGRGNAFFANSVNQFPQKAGSGQKGQVLKIHLEMRLSADIALLGLNPVGPFAQNLFEEKKTKNNEYFYKYLFVKKRPWVKQINSGLKIVEIPGLFKNSSQFLKHILSCRLIIYILAFKDQRQNMRDIQKIDLFLKKYDPSLLKKKCLVYFKIIQDVFDYKQNNLIKMNQDFLLKKNIENFYDVLSLENAVKKYVQ